MANANIVEVNFPIIGGSNIQRAEAFDSQLASNWYPFYESVTQQWIQAFFAGSNIVGEFEITNPAFKGRAGGFISLENTAYAVIGDTVYEIDLAFNLTAIGVIGSAVGTVSMCAGTSYIMIVDGTGGWTYNVPTNDFQPIADPDFPVSPTSCEEQQGFFLVNNSGTQDVFQSAEGDPTKWDELTRFECNFKSSYLANPVIAIHSINARLFVFTLGFIQVYENQGTVGVSFRPDKNLIFGYGALVQAGIAKGTAGALSEQEPEFLIFLSRTPDGTKKIMMTSGNPPEVVSTPSIDYRLNQLTAPQECVALTWTENGQTFAHFNFNTDKTTLVYNVTNKTWFDLKYNGNNRHFTEAFSFFNNKKLMTSYLNNNLYEMSENLITNAGTPIQRIRVSNNMRVGGYRNVTGMYLELYFQQGVGLPGSILLDTKYYVYGADPELYLYISYDGGQTFSEPERKSLGTLADRIFTTRFTGLGTSKDWTFKLEISAPVKVFLMGANFAYTIAGGSG